MNAEDSGISGMGDSHEASELKFSTIFHTSPDAIHINRLFDGLYVDVNKGFSALTGFTADDVAGRTSTDLGVWQDPADRARLLAALESDGEIHGFVAPFRRKDGAVITTFMAAKVIVLEGETCIISVTQDISEQERAETRLRRLNRVYAVLSGINKAIVHMRQPQALFDEACRVIVEEGGFRASWVGLVDTDGRHVRVAAQAGATEGYLDRADIILGDEQRGRGPTGVCISEGIHVFSQDIERDPAMVPWRENALRHGYRSSASFPLIVRGAVVGAYTMYAGESGFFTDEQVELLDELAADLSFAMEFAEVEDRRRQAEEDLERRRIQLEELLEERERNLELVERSLSSIIGVVTHVVELRDPYTAGHQRRVSEVATRISEEMGLPALQVEEIRVAALIHDVGKMSVPSEILSKPGARSPLEHSLIQGHAEAGYRIIAAAHMEGPAAEIAYQHHERCDGSGYPRGLRGEQLLVGAKVLMVADVVEAMMSDRPYRPGLGPDAALAEVCDGAGTRYDAEVVSACERVFAHGFVLLEL